MSRRLAVCVPSLVLLFAVSASAFAQSHVVAQKTSKLEAGTVFLSLGLLPGHVYRVDVTASGHHPFVGNAIENYLGVSNGRLGQGSKPITLNGTTPKSFSVNQPVSGKLSSWLIGLNVRIKSGRNLTVRVIDLGNHK